MRTYWLGSDGISLTLDRDLYLILISAGYVTSIYTNKDFMLLFLYNLILGLASPLMTNGISIYIVYVVSFIAGFVNGGIHICKIFSMSCWRFSIKWKHDMCATNDPLGQIHSPTSRYHNSHLKFAWLDLHTPCVKMIITCSDCELALWINNSIVFMNCRCQCIVS